MIKFSTKYIHYFNGVKSRFQRTGLIRSQLILSKELVKKYPNEQYAFEVYIFFMKKFFFGRVKYNTLYNDAWSKLNSHIKDGIYHFGSLKFVFDSAFAFDFTGIYFCDNYQRPIDYEFETESEIAKEVLSIVGTSEGSYTSEHVKIEKGDVVIDAGANMGLFSIFSSYHGARMTYAFEPQKQAIELMKKNIALNSMMSNIKIVEYGLCDKDEAIKMNFNSEFHVAASIVMSFNGGETETINCVTLDKWAEDNCISQIDFIKADIEGAERLFLKGAQRILAKHAPKLAICTYHLPDDKEVLTKLILNANPNYIIKYTSHKLFAYVPTELDSLVQE